MRNPVAAEMPGLASGETGGLTSRTVGVRPGFVVGRQPADEAAQAEQRIRQITGWEVIRISAQERIGLPPLIAAMAAMLRGAA